MKKVLAMVFGLVLVLSAAISAQNRLMWEDTFSDEDPLALKNVAWSQYGPQLLPGSVVEQRNEALFLQTGSFGGMLAAVIAQTNGLPELAFDEMGNPTPESFKNIRKNYYCSPNQSVVFQVTFKKNTGSAFMFATRLVGVADSLNAEPTQSPGYALLINPLDGSMLIGKYEGAMAILNPTVWKVLGMGKSKFMLNVAFWVKVSINQGEMKVKVWEGEVTDEPTEWSISGIDDDPRVAGTFSLFGLFNTVNTLADDQCTIDNVAVYKEGDDLWSDNFDDVDLAARVNVGWMYYDATILPGSVVEQREGALFLQTGSFGGMIGTVLAETNGVPEYILDETGIALTERGKVLVKRNYFNDPNHIITFQITFKKNDGAFIVVSTRMEPVPDSTITDPTASPGYGLMISPLQGLISIGKYSGAMAVLNPTTWTMFGAGAYKFALNVSYWFKYYLHNGEIKVKVWEGEPTDEPESWQIEGVDTDPRLSGNFTMFGMVNPTKPQAQDQIMVDNITVVKSGPATTSVDRIQVQPGTWQLLQNFPNPFNPSTEIRYQLTRHGSVELVVFNTNGQRVATLVQAEQAAGAYRALWNGRSDDGVVQPSGLYFCRIKTSEFSQTIKMILNK